MAIYHLSCSNISRGKGQSAIASSAYRSGDKLYSERYGESNFYSRKTKPDSFILKPAHAPEWSLNREKLWNEVESIEKQKTARLSREMTIALPKELSNSEQKQLTIEYCKENFVEEGMVADVSIHRDDEENPHFHVMLTTRPFNEDGTWGNKAKKIFITDEDGNKMKTKAGNFKSRKENTTDWDSKERLSIWRKSWAEKTNNYLEIKGYTEKITDKSYKELGEDRKPTIHEGYVAREIEARGEVSERCEKNREIRKENYTKEVDRKENAVEKMTTDIVPMLSPNEKKEIKKLAKDLKIYVNYDNLIDKERMVSNWKNSVNVNKIIQPENYNENIISKIDDTKEYLDKAKDILNKEYVRIYEKHYPELQQYKFSDYQKMTLGMLTLEKDKVLNNVEVKEAFSDIRDKELKDLLKTVTTKPHLKSMKQYVQNVQFSNNKLNDFYKDNNVDIDSVKDLDTEKKDQYKKLYSDLEMKVKVLKIVENYHEKNIQSVYPTVDIESLSAVKKESVSHLVTYYGNTLSFNKVSSLANNEVVNKYTTNEQKIGLDILGKIENNTLTDKDVDDINNDFRKKEIYDTLKNEDTKKLFVNEVSNSGIEEFNNYKSDEANEISEHNTPNSTSKLISGLANNLDIYGGLMYASEGNITRKHKERYEKSKPKHSGKIANRKKNQKPRKYHAPKI